MFQQASCQTYGAQTIPFGCCCNSIASKMLEVASRSALGKKTMNAFKAWMEKRKARANGELKERIKRITNTVTIVAFICILYGPLIVEKNLVNCALMLALGFGWWFWYRLLFLSIKLYAGRAWYITLCKVLCWICLALLPLIVVVNVIRKFYNDAIVYDIIAYVSVGTVTALNLTVFALIVKFENKLEKEDEQKKEQEE